MKAAGPALLPGDAFDGATVPVIAHIIISGNVAARSDLFPADEHAYMSVFPGKFELL